jgi:hypothetical protein
MFWWLFWIVVTWAIFGMYEPVRRRTRITSAVM